MNGSEPTTIGSELFIRAKVLAQVVAVLWMFWIGNALILGKTLNRWGIRPRTVVGLWGIPLAPLLHSDPEHLMGNTIAILVLGGLVLLKGIDTFWLATVAAVLGSGLGTWLFGKDNSIHIGASGVIFGYIGFLMLRGYFEQELISSLLSVLMLFYYSRQLWWGIFHAAERISWEMHLFGFLGGAFAARFLESLKENVSGGVF